MESKAKSKGTARAKRPAAKPGSGRKAKRSASAGSRPSEAADAAGGSPVRSDRTTSERPPPKGGRKSARNAQGTPKATGKRRRAADGPGAASDKAAAAAGARPAPEPGTGSKPGHASTTDRNGATPTAPRHVRPEDRRRPRAPEAAEGSPRPNTLVPTNAVHPTERRLRRRRRQNRTLLALTAAALLGIMILGDRTEPPDMSALEQQLATLRENGPDPLQDRAGAPAIAPPPVVSMPPASETPPRRLGSAQAPPPAMALLDGDELIEMERMLARLDLAPSRADGIVDQRTRHAIRLYQEIAGLPVDGQPSPDLLADLREVVRILDGGD